MLIPNFFRFLEMTCRPYTLERIHSVALAFYGLIHDKNRIKPAKVCLEIYLSFWFLKSVQLTKIFERSHAIAFGLVLVLG
jgi:hypothetical protein